MLMINVFIEVHRLNNEYLMEGIYYDLQKFNYII